MKKRTTTFSFLGFVALADCLFAVSAGLLLLNPVQLEPAKQNDIDPEELATQVVAQIGAIETELAELETSAQVVFQKAADVMRKE